MDQNRQYNQGDLPSDIFNASDGDVKTFNGQQVRVKNNGNGTRSLSPLSATESALKNAEQIRQYNVQANQPAIQTLQKNSTDLQGRYKELLSSIKGQQGVAEDAQTLATNNELGRRGITADSGLGANQIAGALRPIAANFQQLSANTGIAEQNDLNGLAEKIASLQAGDPASAFSGALNINSAEQSANQFQQTLAQQIAQSNKQTAQSPSDRYVNVGASGLLDTTTGKVIQGIDALKTQLGGAASSGW